MWINKKSQVHGSTVGGLPSSSTDRFSQNTIEDAQAMAYYPEALKQVGRRSPSSKYRTLFWQVGREREQQNSAKRSVDDRLGKTESIGYGIFDNLKAILQKLQDLKASSNQQLKSIVSDELITELSDRHEPFKRLDLSLLESILLIGKIQIFAHNQEIPHLSTHICFLLFGSIKLFNQDYKHHLHPGSIFGSQCKLFGVSAELRGRAVEESCLLMVPLQSFRMVREKMVQSKLKNDFQLLESIMRLNFIQKHFPSVWRVK